MLQRAHGRQLRPSEKVKLRTYIDKMASDVDGEGYLSTQRILDLIQLLAVTNPASRQSPSL